MRKIRIAFALTGSFCTFERVFGQMEELAARGYALTPILSFNAAREDTRFASADEVRARLLRLCGTPPLLTLQQVEPIGPKKLADAYVVAPASGASLAKMASGVFDTPALLGAKSHLRNERPLVIAVSTNDGLGLSAQNIGKLLAYRNVFFVPFGQDSPFRKPRSLVAHFELLPETIAHALEGRQLQPILRAPAVPDDSSL